MSHHTKEIDKKEERTAIAGLVLLMIIGGLVLFKDTDNSQKVLDKRNMPFVKGPTTPPPSIPLPPPNGAQR